MADDIREDAAAQNDGPGKRTSGLSGGKAEKTDEQGKDSSNPESLPTGCQPEIRADGKDGCEYREICLADRMQEADETGCEYEKEIQERHSDGGPRVELIIHRQKNEQFGIANFETL